MNPVAYLPKSPRLLDQLSEVMRYRHYSLRTEEAYRYWVRFFVRWSGRGGSMRHPRDMGAADVHDFLSMLANERQVSASTHNQALSALLFLYRKVLGVDLPWLTELQRPARAKRIPAVLTPNEVADLLGALEGGMALLGKLLYGTGMRLMEGLRLRIKDVDFVFNGHPFAGGHSYLFPSQRTQWGQDEFHALIENIPAQPGLNIYDLSFGKNKYQILVLVTNGAVSMASAGPSSTRPITVQPLGTRPGSKVPTRA